jgi:GntR family transcriptional regulator
LHLDPSSATPLYAQVVDQVKSLVASGALRPGDQLPSVRDLAVTLRVNRNTAAKAYQVLESEGVLASRAGHGTFVAAGGGSRWSRDERFRRLERLLDRLLVEAHHLQIDPQEIVPLLERRARLLPRAQVKTTRKE